MDQGCRRRGDTTRRLPRGPVRRLLLPGGDGILGAMTAIYIKCHSRAAYLDRCIRSIKRCVNGHGPIVLLNDGVPRPYLDRLAELYPEIQVRHSPKVTDPPSDPAALESPKYDPAKFWVGEIAKDADDYIVLLEEDTWFVLGFDLDLVLRNLAANSTMMMRFYCNSTSLAVENEVIFWTILGPDASIRYYSPTIKHPLEVYKVFALANGIYYRDYWLYCYADTVHWTAEKEILKRALIYLQQRQAAGQAARFCDFGRDAACPSFHSTGRADSGGQGIPHKIDHKIYNTALDEAWLAGKLDAMAGYPGDIGDQARLAAFGGRLTPQQIEDWSKWRDDYVAMYRRTGAIIS